MANLSVLSGQGSRSPISIMTLRRKLGGPQVIETVPGAGSVTVAAVGRPLS